MELSSPPAAATPSPTTTETDTDTPPIQHLCTALSIPNGSFRPYHLHSFSPPVPVVVVYRECLKNHAATLGGHALDGCGEFMPAPTATPTDPTSLKCAACGCHRNFHRRDPEEDLPPASAITHPYLIEYPRFTVPSPKSISPPPISSYCPSAPQMLLALSTGSGFGFSAKPENTATANRPIFNGGSRKRHRTKFSQEQKEKMYSFSEELGWKMRKKDERVVEEFCTQVGVGKGVFKVWMHNNKHTFGKRDPHHGANGIGIGMDNLSVHPNNNSNNNNTRVGGNCA